MTEPAQRDRPLVIINHLIERPNTVTGITRYLFSLLAVLVARRQYRYVLLTTWDADRLPAELKHDDLAVVSLPFVRSLPLNLLFQTIMLPYYVRKYNAVAEFNCAPMACFLPFWRRLITVHDLYVLTLPQLQRLRDRIWWRVLFPAGVWAAQTIVCVSDSTRQKLAHYFPYAAKKASVVYEAGALMGAAEPPALARRRIGLYVGNIAPSKNIGLLIEALALLEREGDPVEIVFVGQDNTGAIEAAAQKFGLRNPVQSAGALSDAELAGLYDQASFLVTTSLDEGFCLPVVEAHSRALPVVCPDIPIYREIAAEGGLYFPAGDAQALAGRLREVLQDDTLRAALSERAFRNAKRFSWQTAAIEVEKLLAGN
jgi:glycosyltransferase involved in cell wall biosynthesis